MTRKWTHRGVATFAGLTVTACVLAASANAENFYQGKTIDIVVGGAASGGHDRYARALARHLPRHIPGNPSIVVKNMPGAGSAKAAGYLYAVAPKDGTTIAALYPGAILLPLLDVRRKGLYEPAKFQFVGSAESSTRICATFERSKVKTFEDAIETQAIMGGGAPGGATHDYPIMLNAISGTKFKLVSGYKGTNDLALDMERGELDGFCGWDWSTAKAQRPQWVRERKMNILVQVNLEPNDELTNLGVPQMWQFVKNDNDRKAAELLVSQQVFGRPYVLPPQTPAEQVQTLRVAFDATMKDPQFLAEAAKSRLDISPTMGSKLQGLAERIYTTPQPTIARTIEIIKPR